MRNHKRPQSQPWRFVRLMILALVGAAVMGNSVSTAQDTAFIFLASSPSVEPSLFQQAAS